MRVLSIMCHPDDMELDCGGTLLKYKKQGHDVISCYVANGNMGHMVIMPDELREIRTKEAEKAGELAGFKIVNGDVGDLCVNAADVKQQEMVIKVIREAQPDFIITHNPNDYCSDHAETSKLVFNAAFSASCPHFKPELGAPAKVTPIYYCDNSNGINVIHTEYVDITEEIDLKMEMLACHESQLVWLRDHDGIDVIADERAKAAFRGIQCNVKYAEGFTQLLSAQRLVTYRMLP